MEIYGHVRIRGAHYLSFVPLQMSIIHLIIYYHVIGRKFNKLLRALENQYLLNAVYV